MSQSQRGFARVRRRTALRAAKVAIPMLVLFAVGCFALMAWWYAGPTAGLLLAFLLVWTIQAGRRAVRREH